MFQTVGHPLICWFLPGFSSLPRRCTAARRSGSPGPGCRSTFRGSSSRFRQMFHSGAVPKSGRSRPCPGPGWVLRRGALVSFSFTRRVPGGEGVRGGSLKSDTFVHCRCPFSTFLQQCFSHRSVVSCYMLHWTTKHMPQA